MTDRQQQLPTHDPFGNPYVKRGECPFCGAPERTGGMRAGNSMSFECDTRVMPRGGGHGLIAYDARETARSATCEANDREHGLPVHQTSCARCSMGASSSDLNGDGLCRDCEGTLADNTPDPSPAERDALVAEYRERFNRMEAALEKTRAERDTIRETHGRAEHRYDKAKLDVHELRTKLDASLAVVKAAEAWRNWNEEADPLQIEYSKLVNNLNDAVDKYQKDSD